MTSQEQAKYLKNLKNGRVFIFNELLSKRDDMVPCDVNGNISEGHYADANEEGEITRVKTPYLGNPVNGVLFPFTDILALREDLVSINTPEEWQDYMKNRDGNAQVEVLPGGKVDGEPVADAPVLGRSQPAEDVSHETTTDSVETGSKSVEGAGIGLPNIEGMNARDAKTALSDWAENHYGHKLDRRPKLDIVIAEAQALMTKKAG